MIEKNGWKVLVIPAIAPSDTTYRTGPGPKDLHDRKEGEVLLPEREPPEVLDALRVELGSMNFSAQYMQDPRPPGGNAIQREWLRYYEREPPEFERTVTSWDLACTTNQNSSFSVGLYWGEYDRHYYLLDMARRKLDAPSLCHLIIKWERKWGPDYSIIEKTELGESMCQDLWPTTELRPKLMTSRIDKYARLLTQSARFEGGRVLLPTRADWLRAYQDELLAFPYGKNDDQVDATSQALHFLTGKGSVRPPNVRVRFFG